MLEPEPEKSSAREPRWNTFASSSVCVSSCSPSAKYVPIPVQYRSEILRGVWNWI